MAEKKHTPGPWTYDNEGVILTTDGIIIADTYWDRKLSLNEGSANLKLAAAAPELLALCERIADIDVPSAAYIETLIHQARAAIKKATE